MTDDPSSGPSQAIGPTPPSTREETAFIASQLTAAGFPAGAEEGFVVLPLAVAGELLQLVDAVRGLRAPLEQLSDAGLRTAAGSAVAALPPAER